MDSVNVFLGVWTIGLSISVGKIWYGGEPVKDKFLSSGKWSAVCGNSQESVFLARGTECETY